jgi:hypothetical protein
MSRIATLVLQGPSSWLGSKGKMPHLLRIETVGKIFLHIIEPCIVIPDYGPLPILNFNALFLESETSAHPSNKLRSITLKLVAVLQVN